MYKRQGLEDRRGKRKKDQVPRTELEKAQIEIEQLKHKDVYKRQRLYTLPPAAEAVQPRRTDNLEEALDGVVEGLSLIHIFSSMSDEKNRTVAGRST